MYNKRTTHERQAMTWQKYLKRKSYIARRMFVTRQTIYNWEKDNYVPDILFVQLKEVLKELGHELSETEMRELNE